MSKKQIKDWKTQVGMEWEQDENPDN